MWMRRRGQDDVDVADGRDDVDGVQSDNVSTREYAYNNYMHVNPIWL